jgi:hypothetical protein
MQWSHTAQMPCIASAWKFFLVLQTSDYAYQYHVFILFGTFRMKNCRNSFLCFAMPICPLTIHFTLQLLHGPHAIVDSWLVVVEEWLIVVFMCTTHSQDYEWDVDTGSAVTNVAWSKDSSALVSFLHIQIVSSFVVEILFLTKVRSIFHVWNKGWSIWSWWNLFLTFMMLNLKTHYRVKRIKLQQMQNWMWLCGSCMPYLDQKALERFRGLVPKKASRAVLCVCWEEFFMLCISV